MVWTTELVTSLERLWNEGASTAEIGRQLGVSKNAVVGKAHRLGLSGRPSPIRQVPVRKVAAHAKGPSCQWPIGDPQDADFHFCGAPALPGKPYCASHCSMAYTSGGGGGKDSSAEHRAA